MKADKGCHNLEQLSQHHLTFRRNLIPNIFWRQILRSNKPGIDLYET